MHAHADELGDHLAGGRDALGQFTHGDRPGDDDRLFDDDGLADFIALPAAGDAAFAARANGGRGEVGTCAAGVRAPYPARKRRCASVFFFRIRAPRGGGVSRRRFAGRAQSGGGVGGAMGPPASPGRTGAWWRCSPWCGGRCSLVFRAAEGRCALRTARRAFRTHGAAAACGTMPAALTIPKSASGLKPPSVSGVINKFARAFFAFGGRGPSCRGGWRLPVAAGRGAGSVAAGASRGRLRRCRAAGVCASVAGMRLMTRGHGARAPRRRRFSFRFHQGTATRGAGGGGGGLQGAGRGGRCQCRCAEGAGAGVGTAGGGGGRSRGGLAGSGAPLGLPLPWGAPAAVAPLELQPPLCVRNRGFAQPFPHQHG